MLDYGSSAYKKADDATTVLDRWTIGPPTSRNAFCTIRRISTFEKWDRCAEWSAKPSYTSMVVLSALANTPSGL